MAEMPPPINASAAQAGFAAREAGKERDARQVGRVDAARRHVQSVDDAQTSVDTEDADTAVFTESEGQGSQGRTPDDEVSSNAPEADEKGTENGVRQGDDGRLHIDIQA